MLHELCAEQVVVHLEGALGGEQLELGHLARHAHNSQEVDAVEAVVAHLEHAQVGRAALEQDDERLVAARQPILAQIEVLDDHVRRVGQVVEVALDQRARVQAEILQRMLERAEQRGQTAAERRSAQVEPVQVRQLAEGGRHLPRTLGILTIVDQVARQVERAQVGQLADQRYDVLDALFRYRVVLQAKSFDMLSNKNKKKR